MLTATCYRRFTSVESVLTPTVRKIIPQRGVANTLRENAKARALACFSTAIQCAGDGAVPGQRGGFSPCPPLHSDAALTK